jgi:hypothetical protein
MEPDGEWIKSAGGPLICVERELAHCWRGAIRTNAGIDAPALSLSDYDRACRIREYLGAIDLEKGRALVLGDMPLETSVWKDATDSPFIVRLFYIDPGTDVPQVLRRIGDLLFVDLEEAINFEIASGQMVIFDSAYPGGDQAKKDLFFECAPGKYRILTKMINPDSRTSMLLHKFCSMM